MASDPGSNNRRKGKKVLTKKEITQSKLLEIAWEVCNQVGGIYTVIRSKVPTIRERWGNNYVLVGPLVHPQVSSEFEPIDEPDDALGAAIKKLRAEGVRVQYGIWLITGRPRVVLLDPASVGSYLSEIKYLLWEHHSISTPPGDALIDGVVAFGHLVKRLLTYMVQDEKCPRHLIAHFHEWMAATPIPDIRREKLPVKTIFTTHATMLGRYVAMNDPMFYQNLPFVDWEKEAKHYHIMPQVQIERAAANDCHLCTTVSDVTAQECIYLLGRTPDAILPNGLNIERFEALHQVQNLHQEYKEKIHRFCMAYFFPSYSFDLDNTLYFFTSGRFEFKNKGFDMTLEALEKLNKRLKEEDSPTTIVMFFITRQPYHSINPEVLHSRALMEELRQTCSAIEKQVGRKLFYTAAGSTNHRLPELNDFVEDYWKLRYRRTLQSWKSDRLPPVVTHNLLDDQKDEILESIREYNLLNFKEDNIKVVYHPDFVSASSPLWGIDYGQFVRGCHLGIFPSYYEPWGYTPLECIARGVPAVTSDLSGFGDYVVKNIKDHDDSGLYVVKRHHREYDKATDELAESLYHFSQLSRRERITLRNKAEGNAIKFDWKTLGKFYEAVYKSVTEL